MKFNKIIFVLITLVILLLGCLGNPKYTLTRNDKLYAESLEGAQSGSSETYTDGNHYFSTTIWTFSSEAESIARIKKIENYYNPASIVLDTHSVKYTGPADGEKVENGKLINYFYKSGNNVVKVDAPYTKICNDCEPIGHDFVRWYYSKYNPN